MGAENVPRPARRRADRKPPEFAVMTPLIVALVGLELPYPNINPVALQLGPVAIKWYGLAYLTGLLFGWLYIRRLLREPRLWANDQPPFEPAKVDDLLLYITAGVVLGGR